MTRVTELNKDKQYTKNDFQIIDIIGSGAYGTVFKVKLKG